MRYLIDSNFPVYRECFIEIGETLRNLGSDSTILSTQAIVEIALSRVERKSIIFLESEVRLAVATAATKILDAIIEEQENSDISKVFSLLSDVLALKHFGPLWLQYPPKNKITS